MSSVAATVKYETTILEVGSEARGFKDINMAILFGDEAPDALRSSCFIIKVNQILEPIKPGDVMMFGDQTYAITAVGNEVNTNLGNLGHTAIVLTVRPHRNWPDHCTWSKSPIRIWMSAPSLRL